MGDGGQREQVVTVQEVTLQQSSMTLCVRAHAALFLSYAQLCVEAGRIAETIAQPGVTVEVIIRNPVENEQLLLAFVKEALTDRLGDAFSAFELSMEGEGALCIDYTPSPRYDDETLRALMQRERSWLVGTLGSLHTFTWTNRAAALDNIAQEEATPAPAKIVDKPKSAPPTAGKKGKQPFMPGVKRKLIEGKPFAPRRVDAISSLTLESGSVNILGTSIKFEAIKTRQGDGYVINFSVTDHYETAQVKWFAPDRKMMELCTRFLDPAGPFGGQGKVGVKGLYRFDTKFAKSAVIMAEDITWFDIPSRSDEAPQKRVELHAHTKMSPDGLAKTDQLIKTAAAFGHPAIAVTDHGVVQAFPDAYMAAKQAGIKLIYGVEAYLANDLPYEGEDGPLNELVVFDIETTGLNPKQDTLIEIGAVRLRDGAIVDTFGTFVDPKRPLSTQITELTGIKPDMLVGAPALSQALCDFAAFVGDTPLVAHNAWFDMAFIRNAGVPLGHAFAQGVLDTLTLARLLLPEQNRHGLAALVKTMNISLKNHHRASDDAAATAQILLQLLAMTDATTLAALNGSGKTRAMPTYHAVLLAKNQRGLNALYRLVTESHLTHYHRRPVIPKSLLMQHREHLLLGSGCEQGEVFRAVLGGADEQHLAALGSFYDYLEIQPLENNAFLLRDEREARHITTLEQLADLNDAILSLGETLDRRVVATCDVHFVEPEEEYFRRILMTGQGFSDMDEQPALYLRTTEEMLQLFLPLGEQKAHEVVVDNPRWVAEQIEATFPPFLHEKETYVPQEAGGKQLVCDIARAGAQEIYGAPLPPMIEQRLEHELECITKHGFEVLYLAAHRLVKRSVEDGYSVGSRGSVGSSFTATAMGISEINPLPTHYRCAHCKTTDFDVADTGAQCGLDLPDRTCPTCGAPLIKDGYDIPFEVFLGFDGDKVPDIDLNFSGEYQERAFAYVESMFGSDNVFRAGTVVGVAEKTAVGYVLKYMEQNGQSASHEQVGYLARGIEGVKRTTGQHPGGLVVLPQGMDIFDFTPLQRPADKMESQTITTHFDFNSLHDRLVKLDILGHDNPTMMRRLLEFTGIDPATVPLDDEKTLSLFTGCEALGLDPKTLGVNTGTLGIPEFGTSFVLGMLEETKPITVAELLRISGLSHGTDVWLSNAQDLIKSGTATLMECICTRDDIMNYLISVEVEPLMAFKIMESVRKGRGLNSEMEVAMRAMRVPAWFIDSCQKIKYMFPKAHAAAYVVSALRIGYFKVHHPLAYYAAYFSVRGEEMNAINVLRGLPALDAAIKAVEHKQPRTTRDEKELSHLLIAREMLLRGYEFLPPSLTLSHVQHYLIEDGKLRMALTSVPGLGDNAARSIVEAREQAPITTIEDLIERTKVNTTIVEKLRETGALEGMAQSAQLSFFDLGL